MGLFFYINILRKNLANRQESSLISLDSCPIRAAFGVFLIFRDRFVNVFFSQVKSRNEIIQALICCQMTKKVSFWIRCVKGRGIKIMLGHFQ